MSCSALALARSANRRESASSRESTSASDRPCLRQAQPRPVHQLLVLRGDPSQQTTPPLALGRRQTGLSLWKRGHSAALEGIGQVAEAIR